MATFPHFGFRALLGASALSLALLTVPAVAETIFTPTSDGFAGMVNAGGPARGVPVVAGSKAVIAGERLVPGQEITLMRGRTVLNADGPIIVDAEGKFRFELEVDAEAATGLQPILVIGEKPAAATVVDLKISPVVPLQGADIFTVKSEPVTRGLYQVRFSERAGAVFVTSAAGRPPVRQSELVKIDPESLAILARTSPGPAPLPENPPPGPKGAPAPTDGGLFAVYGVDVDEKNGTVWATNTRQDTVAVYAQDDLSLVKQFPPGTVTHARDVIVDEVNGRAYVGATGTGDIKVFDTATLEELPPITIRSAKRDGDFSVMSLDIDEPSGTLVTVSMTTDEAAVVDLASGAVRLVPLPGARGASGIAYDAKEDLLFVASQSSDNLLIVKAATGEVLADVETGAGALNVAFEPVGRLAYVANRGAGTITVVDTAGKIVANLDAGNLPNQLRADGKGNIWAVNKARGEDDEAGDRIWKITPVAR